MKGGAIISIKYETAIRKLRAWLAQRIAWFACVVEGTHFWTAPVRIPQYGGRRMRICSRCGRLGKPFQHT